MFLYKTNKYTNNKFTWNNFTNYCQSLFIYMVKYSTVNHSPYHDTLNSWNYFMNSISSFGVVFVILIPVKILWQKVPSWLKPRIYTTPNASFDWMDNTKFIYATVSVPMIFWCKLKIMSIIIDYVLVVCEKWQITKWKNLLVNDYIEFFFMNIYISVSVL